jgi:hypothetical protein
LIILRVKAPVWHFNHNAVLLAYKGVGSCTYVRLALWECFSNTPAVFLRIKAPIWRFNHNATRWQSHIRALGIMGVFFNTPAVFLRIKAPIWRFNHNAVLLAYKGVGSRTYVRLALWECFSTLPLFF